MLSICLLGLGEMIQDNIHVFFYKHINFRNQARLCLAVYDFEARNMLSLCLTFQGTGLPEWNKFNSNEATKSESNLSDFY